MKGNNPGFKNFPKFLFVHMSRLSIMVKKNLFLLVYVYNDLYSDVSYVELTVNLNNYLSL